MSHFIKSKLYKEECRYIFSKRANCVRGVTVISAFIEGQIFSLASIFLRKHKVKHDPEPAQEFYQSLNILKVNRILTLDESEKIKEFRKKRNKCIHGIFKGMTRPAWEKQNNLVIELGRPIVKLLDEKLEKE